MAAVVGALSLVACGDDGSPGCCDGDDVCSCDGGGITEGQCLAMGWGWCDGRCVDTQLSNIHCGGCGIACGDSTCRMGVCDSSCPASAPVACGTRCCPSRCNASGSACAEPATECPPTPPADGDACVDVAVSYEGARCDWLRCDAEGFIQARCESETWSVTTTACDAHECGTESCGGDEICVERAGGALLTECAANPCDGALYSDCMCELCSPSDGCAVGPRAVTCNSCPDGSCP